MMKKTVMLFMLLSIFAKAIAFGREMVLSYCFGASEISDIFLLSLTIPITVFGFVSAGIISGFIPVYQKICNEKSVEEAGLFSNRIMNLLMIACLIMILIYYLTSKCFLRMFASGFSMDKIECAEQFTDISIWTILFTAVTTVLLGYLQANNHISVTALSSVPLNVGIIAAMCTASLTGKIMILPIGFLLAAILQVLCLWGIAKKSGYQHQLSLGRKDKYVKLFLGSLGLLTISSSVQQINLLVDRTLATQAGVGGLSLYEYGNRINDFIMGMTIIPISTAMFPVMVKNAVNTEQLTNIVKKGISLFANIMIPLTMFIAVFSESIVKMIYYRGAFDSLSVDDTAEIVLYYGVGLYAFAMRELLVKLHYSLGDIRTPMINAIMALCINIILNFIFFKIIGLGGLALATTVSAYVTVFMLEKSVGKRLQGMHEKKTWKQGTLSLGISMICVVGAYYFHQWLLSIVFAEVVNFLLTAALFGITYMVLVLVVGVMDRNDLKEILKRYK